MAGGIAYIPSHARLILVISLVVNICIGIFVFIWQRSHRPTGHVPPWPNWLSWFILAELIVYSLLDLAHNATHF